MSSCTRGRYPITEPKSSGMVSAAASADSVTSACTETATGEGEWATGGVDAAPVVAVTAAIAATVHITAREVFLFMAFDAR